MFLRWFCWLFGNVCFSRTISLIICRHKEYKLFAECQQTPLDHENHRFARWLPRRGVSMPGPGKKSYLKTNLVLKNYRPSLPVPGLRYTGFVPLFPKVYRDIQKTG